MKVLPFAPIPPAEAHALMGQMVPGSGWEPNVVAPALLVDAETEAPIMLVARFPDRGGLGLLRAALRSYPMGTTWRAAGIRNRSSVFGFVGRRAVMRRDGCRPCGGATTGHHDVIVAAGGVLADLLASVLPDQAHSDRELVAGAVRPEWCLPACPWTSGVVNESSSLPYHYDRNNFPTWSAMVVVRRGMRGGFLHLPQYGAVVDCRDGDVVFFPGWAILHGVTPMTRSASDGYRYSAVYYAVSDMAHCLSPDEELALSRATRTRRESDLRPADERLRG